MFLFGEGRRRGCPGLVARSGTKFVTTFDFGLFCVNYILIGSIKNYLDHVRPCVMK